MKVNIVRNKLVPLPVLLLGILLLCLISSGKASAEDAKVITIGKIDYDNLTMQIYDNNNSAVYYSIDKDTWIDVEGPYNSETDSYSLDISWVSNTSDVTLYFKGNTIKTIKPITLPAQNKSVKVAYDKVEGEFTFSNTWDAEYFQWRKSTDYSWATVELDESSSSYISFINTMETLRLQGAKVYIRTPQMIGTNSNNEGSRPSIEVLVSITKRSNAPSIKVNVSKLNINTTEAMEYYNSTTKLWIECTKAMSLEDIAPEVLYKNGANDLTFMIRTAATSYTSYSKTAYITVNGQAAAPVIGDNSDDVAYYYVNSKLILQFPKASKTNTYEYAIIKPDSTFNESTAIWKAVISSKIMTISKTSSPDSCKIYVRRKGISANKNISLVLPSAINSFTINYPH